MDSGLSQRLTIVLVEPQQPGNIGMVVRAMANFGVDDLRLVNPCPHLHPEARKFAVGAAPLLGRARIYDSLPAALGDLTFSVAATRRTGRLRGELLDVAAAAHQVRQGGSQDRIGLVFGREDAGLTSEEVALCSCSATIATAPEVGSLNLAQAVVVFLYEFTRELAAAGVAAEAASERLPQAELEPLFAQIEALLTRIAFINPSCPEAVLNRLRRLLHRAAPDGEDLNLLRGLCSQLTWSINDWRGRKRGG